MIYVMVAVSYIFWRIITENAEAPANGALETAARTLCSNAGKPTANSDITSGDSTRRDAISVVEKPEEPRS